MSPTGQTPDGKKRSVHLSEYVGMWPTPQARDHRDGRIGAETAAANARPLNEFAVTMWSTPRASDGEKGGPNMAFGAGGTPLPTQAATFPPFPRGPTTSTAGDASSVEILTSPPRRPGRSRTQLNPEFVTWLMGWPIGWTACAVSATEWSRWWRLMRGSLSRLHSGRTWDAE